MRILFLTSRFPHPPRRGDQARAFHQIRLLSQRHAITLLSFREGASPESIRAVAALCDEVQVVDLPLWRKALNVARGVVTAQPIQVALYESPTMRRLVGERIRSYDVAHVQMVRMAPYIQPGAPVVLDLIDALSVNMERRAGHDRSPMGFAARIEARLLRRYERYACRRVQRSAVVSGADREALGTIPGLEVNPQGVDLDAFPFVEGPRERDAVAFTGNLGYFVNADAVVFLATRVWPRIRAARPGASLCIVGDRPASRVRRLAELPGVRVMGPVESMHPHLARARVAMAPTRTGSGMQTKVLEAMATGTPVVATSLAAMGLEARNGEHLLLAEGAEDLAAAVVRLLEDEALCRRLAANARRLVEARYTWERSVEGLERLYEAVAGPGGLEASA